MWIPYPIIRISQLVIYITSNLRNKQMRTEIKCEELNNRVRTLDERSSFEFREIKHRYTVWCMTEAGPFRSHLKNIGLTDSNECRLCKTEKETAHHLIFHCTSRPNRPQNTQNCEQYEHESIKLINELKKTI